MKKVLVIEDEGFLGRALKSKFEKAEFQVLLASNGKQGLEMAQEEAPDVILLDIVLPKMDGLTVLKNLKEDKKLKDVPVIMLTNLSDDKTVAKATEGGAHDYLVKLDYNINDVVAKVEEKLS